ncbi:MULTISPECIES: hypothetical protein [pseudomallei group]|uniref:Uncharacterized protein n=2 Tax=Burkholderia mallei TaxID=13373 RepID=A2SAQ4_BURM9|nr:MULTISPECIES: hypothetical protein [pseudomallei group]ABM50631.1 hypothetical protein BMASAVP1_A2237 [Burkholderia mallei SAVP1]ABN03550.1 hypothetical protein BMA10229_A3082 [Burkholderia mallei NCTC 10229]ABO06323.1 hypothetical protein BMA10247_1509 [Burkholderia mallei NCTC 10247]ARK69134.1 hypothetical protein BOC38_14905 [Burkholderia pseudomallei]EDK56976.1 hypothetical protein BMAFMH_C1291 [Burkholderia mallei FMH]
MRRVARGRRRRVGGGHRLVQGADTVQKHSARFNCTVRRRARRLRRLRRLRRKREPVAGEHGGRTARTIDDRTAHVLVDVLDSRAIRVLPRETCT